MGGANLDAAWVAAASADEVAAAGRMGRARTATTPIGRGPSYPSGEHVPVVYARDLIPALHWSRTVQYRHASKDEGDDQGDDEGDEGDDHVEICCDKPDAESRYYYSEYEYYSDDSD